MRISDWSSDVCSSDLADRHVARADAADPRRTADVADGGVAGTDRAQVQRTDVAGFQVAGAQRCGQFAAHAGGAHVARAGVDPGTERAADACLAAADLYLPGHAVRHAGLPLPCGGGAPEQGAPAYIAFAPRGDAQHVTGVV